MGDVLKLSNPATYNLRTPKGTRNSEVWYRLKIKKIVPLFHLLRYILENGNLLVYAVYERTFCNMLVPS